jgi:K+-transporting ATPase, KdpF subunit
MESVFEIILAMIMAFAILVYLIYTLTKPEKF